MKKIRFIRASYFIWLIVPVLLYAVYLHVGLPHMIWSYSWRDDGQGFNPHADRYYQRCTYIGPYGAFTVFPVNGQRDWLLFQRKSAS